MNLEKNRSNSEQIVQSNNYIYPTPSGAETNRSKSPTSTPRRPLSARSVSSVRSSADYSTHLHTNDSDQSMGNTTSRRSLTPRSARYDENGKHIESYAEMTLSARMHNHTVPVSSKRRHIIEEIVKTEKYVLLLL